MSDNYLTFSCENKVYEKLNLDFSKDIDEQFQILLKNKDNVSILLMNKLISKITNFEDQCTKYFNLINDAFKNEMNKTITISNYYDIVVILSSLSNFFKIFSINYQSYNEKFKSILKHIPQFLQLFFKLLKSNFENFFSISFDNNKPKLLESCFILIITFINYYPSNMRPYQKTIESYLKNIFELFIYNYDKINLKELKTYFFTYILLYRLSPQLNLRLQENISNIIANIKFFIEFFKPKSIDDNIEKIEENNFSFIFDIQNINKTNLLHGNKIMILLFKFLEHIFISLPKDIYFDLNFKEIFEFYILVINNYSKLNEQFMGITFNGLSKKEYEIFYNNLNHLILESLTFFLDNYSKYLIPHFELIDKIFNKLLLNDSYLKNIILYSLLLKCFISFIKTFHLYLPNIIDEIIFHFVYSSFPTLYFEFLEINDKTVVKIEDSYIKLNNKKSKIKTKNNNAILSSSEKILHSFSKKELEHILNLYLELLENFVNIEYFSFNKNYKSLLSGIINLLILPSYAKFIFYINESIKIKILNIIYISVRNNKCDFNKWKLLHFLNGFFTNNNLVSTQIENIIKILNLKDNETYINNENDLTGQILDLNIKISELIKQTKKSFEENSELNKKRKLLKEDEINTNNKKQKIEEIPQINNNNINTSINIEDESKKPKIIKEIKNEDIILTNIKENENKEKQNENEENDEIDIPDIF